MLESGLVEVPDYSWRLKLKNSLNFESHTR